MCSNLRQVPTVGQNWTVDPFAGLLRDGFVWGRGSIDDKQAVVSILEAVEHLLASGFAPQRSVFIVFGHDEVRSGWVGCWCWPCLYCRTRLLH